MRDKVISYIVNNQKNSRILIMGQNYNAFPRVKKIACSAGVKGPRIRIASLQGHRGGCLIVVKKAGPEVDVRVITGSVGNIQHKNPIFIPASSSCASKGQLH